jgi:hypothetical protein
MMVASVPSFEGLTSDHLREDFVTGNVFLSTKKYFTCKIMKDALLLHGVPSFRQAPLGGNEEFQLRSGRGTGG